MNKQINKSDDNSIKSANNTNVQKIVLPTTNRIVSNVFDSTHFTSGGSPQNYPERFSQSQRSVSDYENRMLYLSNIPANDLSDNEINELSDQIKKNTVNRIIHNNNTDAMEYCPNRTPICYIKYKSVTFIMAKADTCMSRKYTFNADGNIDVLCFTDADLFEKLLTTKFFLCRGTNIYPKPRFWIPCDEYYYYRMSLPAFVLNENNIYVKPGFQIHHKYHIRDNRCSALEPEAIDYHIVLHKTSRQLNHSFSDGNYMKSLCGVLFDTDDEAMNIVKGLCLLVRLVPYVKGIIVEDSLDLTMDIGQLSVYQIIRQIIGY